MAKRIAVIGRGIAGLTAARRFREMDFQVTIFGLQEKPGAATRAAMGFNVMRGVRDAREPLHQCKLVGYNRFGSWLADLSRESRIAIPAMLDGHLTEVILDSKELESYRIQDARLRQKERRACVIHLASSEARPPYSLLGLEHQNLSAYVEYPCDGWFDVPAALEALETSLQMRNIERSSLEIVSLRPAPTSGWDLGLSDGTLQSFDEVVLANGIWAETLLEPLGLRWPFRRVAGAVVEAIDSEMPPGILFSRRRSFVSHQGKWWFGAHDLKQYQSYSLDDEEKALAKAQLEHELEQRFPALFQRTSAARLGAKVHAGVRSYFTDRMPAVGIVEVPHSQRRLLVSLGYHKNGLQIADICAENLCRLAQNLDVPDFFHKFSPSRFSLTKSA